jgi:hypothetical protein
MCSKSHALNLTRTRVPHLRRVLAFAPKVGYHKPHPAHRSLDQKPPCPIFAPFYWRKGGIPRTPIRPSFARPETSVPSSLRLFIGARVGHHKPHQSLVQNGLNPPSQTTHSPLVHHFQNDDTIPFRDHIVLVLCRLGANAAKQFCSLKPPRSGPILAPFYWRKLVPPKIAFLSESARGFKRAEESKDPRLFLLLHLLFFVRSHSNHGCPTFGAPLSLRLIPFAVSCGCPCPRQRASSPFNREWNVVS